MEILAIVGPATNYSAVSSLLASSDLRALPALHGLASLAVRSDDPQAAMREMLELLLATFHADAGSIGLLCPDTGELETEIQIGTPSDADASHGLKLGHGITGWCVLNRRSLLVPDVTTEPRYIAVRPTARCEMAAVIQQGDQVMGVIDLESDRVGGFVAADLALLEVFAAEAARVLQRLWELGHLKNKARQLESLITAGQSLVTKFEAQDLFETLTREARRMMQARACALYLHDATKGTVRCAALAHAEIVPPPAGDLPVGSCLVASPIHTRRQVWFADIQSPEFRELLDLPADPALRSGSDRVAAALKLRDPQGNFTAVINLQGDLPTIDPLAIQRCLAGLTNESVDIATIATRIESDADVQNPNIVKAIASLGEGREVAYARDFVRSTGPEHDAPVWRHISVYAFRREALDRFASLPVSTREALRKLEQMRALDNDMRMAVVRVDSVPLGVSAPADLEAARAMLRKKS